MTPAELIAWRERLGLSELAAAKALGTPAGTYRNWEDGRRRIPGAIAVLCRYIERFGRLQQ